MEIDPRQLRLVAQRFRRLATAIRRRGIRSTARTCGMTPMQVQRLARSLEGDGPHSRLNPYVLASVARVFDFPLSLYP